MWSYPYTEEDDNTSSTNEYVVRLGMYESSMWVLVRSAGLAFGKDVMIDTLYAFRVDRKEDSFIPTMA